VFNKKRLVRKEKREKEEKTIQSGGRCDGVE
jgi:hypothetical protein